MTMNRETITKQLRDAIPLGDHQTPHAEYITVRLDVVQAAADELAARHSKSVYLDNLHYFFAQTDGTYKYPSGAIGDLLRQAKTEIEGASRERLAITHLQEVLNKPRTHAQQQNADTAARAWLISIGSEPS